MPDNGPSAPLPQQPVAHGGAVPGMPPVFPAQHHAPEPLPPPVPPAPPVIVAPQKMRVLHTAADEAYDIVGQVGEGTYGQVYKAVSERSGVLVALKKIRMEAEKEGFPVTSMREIKLLQGLRHENVVRLHELMTSRTGSVYMVFEYVEHDLSGLLSHPAVAFTPAHLKSLAYQLLSGLAYLHKRSVLHRDLKSSNLLLSNAGELKLADFGLARTYFKRRKGDYTNRVVTLWYRAPELLLGATQYGPAVDTWGAGCLFLELFSRRPIFQGHDELHQLHVLKSLLGPLDTASWPDAASLPWFELLREPNTSDTHAGAPDAFSERYADLVSPAALSLARSLLRYDPRERLSASDALSHEYFTSELPVAEKPADVLKSLGGEWHEMASKRWRKTRRGT